MIGDDSMAAILKWTHTHTKSCPVSGAAGKAELKIDGDSGPTKRKSSGTCRPELRPRNSATLRELQRWPNSTHLLVVG
jgi:hypothetical protein